MKYNQGIANDRGVLDETHPAGQSPIRLRLFSLDSLALGAVFLRVTDIHLPVGYLAGFTTSRDVNVVLLFFFAFYLAARHKTLAQLPSTVIAGWACALGAAPALIMGLQLLSNGNLITTDRLVYWSVLAGLFAVLLLVVIVLWARWGPRLSTPFFLACIGATWVGFVVNWLDYDFLRKVMDFNSNSLAVSAWTGQTTGFYPWPNEAALALVLYIASLAGTRKFLVSSYLLQTIVWASCLVGVLVTGSRTSLLLLAVALMWYIKNLFSAHLVVSSSTVRRTRALIAPLIPLTIIGASLFFFALVVNSRQDIAVAINSRFSSIADIISGTDASTNMRISILSQYYSDLKASPLLGHGPDFAMNEMALGAYSSPSQNAWLEWAVKFGAPYALLMALMLIATYRLAVRSARSQPLLLSYARLILTIFALVTFSMMDIFWMPSPVCVLGVLLGVLMHERNECQSDRTNNARKARPRDSMMRPAAYLGQFRAHYGRSHQNATSVIRRKFVI